MPLQRALCILLIACAASVRAAEGGGGGGGGGGAGPDASVPAVAPSEAGNAACVNYPTLPGPKGSAQAVKKLAADGLGTPDWLKERGVKVEDWETLDQTERADRRFEVIAREYCLVYEKAKAYADWAGDISLKPAGELCGLHVPVLQKWKKWAAEAAILHSILRSKLPYGMAALHEGDTASKIVIETIGTAQASGRVASAKIGLIANQCAYGESQMKGIRDGKALAGTQKKLGATINGAALDKAFDNTQLRTGTPVHSTPGDASRKGNLRPTGSIKPGAKTGAVPLETFESLTAGIVYEGSAGNVSKREDRKRKQLLDQALRHIYSIPEGKKVLRDIQEVRRLKGAELEAERPQIEAQAKNRVKDLKTLERAKIILEEKTPAREQNSPRLLDRREDKNGELDRVDPYKELKKCPEGQRPIVIDFPNPGDKACRKGTDAPGLFLPEKAKDVDLKAGEKVERCPQGHTPVLSMVPNAGDRSCRPPDDPDMVKNIGPGPYHYVATNNPFQPYQIYTKCPEKSQPVISNWPKPGDLACLGAGSFGSLAQVKEKIKEAEKQVDVDKIWLAASEKSALPRVGIQFGGTGPLEGGHANPTQYKLMAYEDGSVSFTTPIVIGEEYLKDGNPSRAVDKILIHELRHTADKGMFEAAEASYTRWLIGEDRAYLSQARAVMEQQPGMRRERKSRIVSSMKDHLVEPALRNPKAFRLDRLSSPLYLWHVTHADLNSPQTGLEGRLEQAYNMILMSHGSQRAAILREIDITGELAMAFAKTQAEKLRSDNVYGEERRSLFLKNASRTRLAQNWLDGLERLRRAPSEDGQTPAWKERFNSMEAEFWKDLESFSARYTRK